MDKTQRLDTRLAAIREMALAVDFEKEQEALSKVYVVDILPSLPKGAADFYPQWKVARDHETTADYSEVCKKIGAGYDRGAQRYVIDKSKVRDAQTHLIEAGFLPCISPSLLCG
jgi:hypothetical protein